VGGEARALIRLTAMTIRYVEQKHRMGCGIACLAMICGHEYDAVADWLGLEWFRQDGLSPWSYYGYLAAHGYSGAPLLPHRDANGEIEPPWPPAPFADMHLVQIGEAIMPHLIVMQRDGTIFDPSNKEMNRLSDYPNWCAAYCVAGIFRIAPHR
jgi:hypothetical protein